MLSLEKQTVKFKALPPVYSFFSRNQGKTDFDTSYVKIKRASHSIIKAAKILYPEFLL